MLRAVVHLLIGAVGHAEWRCSGDRISVGADRIIVVLGFEERIPTRLQLRHLVSTIRAVRHFDRASDGVNWVLVYLMS